MRSVLLTVSLLVGFSCAQDYVVETSANITSLAVEPTDVICKTCACSEGTVDCAKRNLKSFFTIADWAGLKDANVTAVDLTSNPLPSVTQIAELPIQTLNMSSCQIEKIQNFAFSYLQELAVLDLSHNKIATLALSRWVFERYPKMQPAESGFEPHAPQDFVSMRTLSLAFNDIHSLPQDLFERMPGLTSLDLSGNPFAYIDQVTQATITCLQNLRELKLSSCELDYLPDGLFRRLRRLERLDLSDNRFTAVPSVLGEATKLRYLSLNKNLMADFSKTTALSSLTKLQELHLCRLSKLTSIAEGALGGLESLVALHICHNPRLTTLDPKFLMWTDDHDVHRYPLLQTLHMQSNNMSRIRSNFLERWDQLADLDFGNNPYQCDCTAQWMVEILVPLVATSKTNDTISDMFCNKPEDIRGMSFATLAATGRTLVCPVNENLTEVPAPDTAIILGIMIGIFATFPIVLILVLLWRRDSFARCRRKVLREQPNSDDEADAF